MKSLILIILLITPGVWSGNWKVTLKNQCALRGSSVVIKCEYDYPNARIVTSVYWYKEQYISGSWTLVHLSDLPSPPDHSYVGNRWTDCSLQINDVRWSDEGRYHFSFFTTLGGGWTSRSFSRLSVKELKTIVEPGTVTEGENVRLTCESECPKPVYVVWFRDGQRIQNPGLFQSSREHAGGYYCAVEGQETVRSASVSLNVQYAPEKVTLSMSPSGDIVSGRSVTFTCSSDANPPVTQSGYSLYKDGQFLWSGLNYTISDIQPSHSGLYYCHAWNNISWRGMDHSNSTEVPLRVLYRPLNITISMNPPRVVGNSGVNMTCSSNANPAADYTWYMRTDSTSSMLYVSSGQVLSLPFVEASHIGLYLCQASNRLGADNSTEMPLIMKEEELDYQYLPIIAGIGVFLIVTLVLAILFWRKQTGHAEDKTVLDCENDSRASAGVDAHVYTLPSSPPPVSDVTPHSHAPTTYEDELVYSKVTFIPRHPSRSYHKDNGKALQHQRFKEEENENSVIYAKVAKSS